MSCSSICFFTIQQQSEGILGRLSLPCSSHYTYIQLHLIWNEWRIPPQDSCSFSWSEEIWEIVRVLLSFIHFFLSLSSSYCNGSEWVPCSLWNHLKHDNSSLLIVCCYFNRHGKKERENSFNFPFPNGLVCVCVTIDRLQSHKREKEEEEKEKITGTPWNCAHREESGERVKREQRRRTRPLASVKGDTSCRRLFL